MTQLVQRPATEADRDFVFDVKAATMRYAIEAAWGWDESAQRRLHDERFDRGGMEILLVGEERADCLNILREAGRAEMPIDLRVLHANVRAHASYERLGFVVTRTTGAHHEMRWQP